MSDILREGPNTDAIKGLNKAIAAAKGQPDPGETYLHNTDVTRHLDALTDAIREGGSGGGGSQVNSDWNENDNTSKSYILNRPCEIIPSASQGQEKTIVIATYDDEMTVTIPAHDEVKTSIDLPEEMIGYFFHMQGARVVIYDDSSKILADLSMCENGDYFSYIDERNRGGNYSAGKQSFLHPYYIIKVFSWWPYLDAGVYATFDYNASTKSNNIVLHWYNNSDDEVSYSISKIMLVTNDARTGGSNDIIKYNNNNDYFGLTKYNNFNMSRSAVCLGVFNSAFGNMVKIRGSYSLASGYKNEAFSSYSLTSGCHLRNNNDFATVIGFYNYYKYNTTDHLDTLFTIGNGDIIHNNVSSSDGSDAMEVYKDGTAWISGDIYTGSTSGTHKDEGSKKVATEEYVQNYINSLDAREVVY